MLWEGTEKAATTSNFIDFISIYHGNYENGAFWSVKLKTISTEHEKGCVSRQKMFELP